MSAETILVVEDNAVEMSVLAKRLLAEGYEVTRAASGVDALRAARTIRPDLMILDLTLSNEERFNTPLWDGFSLLEWMRRTVPGMDIPVIIHTASPYSTIAAQARASGVAYVFEKGEDLQQVFTAVRKALDQKNTKRAVGE